MRMCTKCPFVWKNPTTVNLSCTQEKSFSVPACSRGVTSSCVLATSLERRKGSSELLAGALNSVWQTAACFGNLGTERWEHRAGSPFPWSGTFPFQLAEHVPTETPRVEGGSNWFFVVLTSCSFAPCCFCSQEGGAVTGLLWDGCCNTGIGKLAWGKGSRLCSKLAAKCVGRNLETSFFREGRQHQSLYRWCVGFPRCCDTQTGLLPLTAAALGVLQPRVLLCRAGSISWCLLCPCQQPLILFCPSRAHTFIVCDQ